MRRLRCGPDTEHFEYSEDFAGAHAEVLAERVAIIEGGLRGVISGVRHAVGIARCVVGAVEVGVVG